VDRRDADAVVMGEMAGSEGVLVQSPSLTARDPRFRRAVSDVLRALRSERDAIVVRSPYRGGGGQISPDGHSALVMFASDGLDGPLHAVADIQRSHPGFTIAELGAGPEGTPR
jgi:hypothetical protein